MTLGALATAAAVATEPTTETDLVIAYLSSPALDLELAAWAASAEAAGTAEVVVANPEIEYRHDEARGPAGARTDALGASITVDLGFGGGARRAAAAAGARAVRSSRDSALIEAVCGLRRDATALSFTVRERAARDQAQARLEGLATTLSQLAAAGEASGYDRDRASLAAGAHRVSVFETQAHATALRGGLRARAGIAVDDVRLSGLPDPGDLDPLLAIALAGHPDLVALRAARDAATKRRVAAQRGAAPDLRVSGAARFDAPPEGGAPTPGFEAGLALELPVIDQGRRPIAESVAGVAEAEAALARREREVAAEVEASWSEALAVTELPLIGPDPAAVWDAARARYAGGEASIDELLQAARDVEDAQLAGLALARLGRDARLDLWCAVGRFDEPAIQSALQEALR